MTVPDSVRQMSEYPQAATAGLNDFLQAYRDNNEWWWRISCGDHQNLFEEAVERIHTLEAHTHRGRKGIGSGIEEESVGDTRQRRQRMVTAEKED